MIKLANSNRLHGLDHLRAIAILLVMVFHFGKGVPSWLGPIQEIGWTGVDLFFVLSGYLIGFQLLKEYKDTHRISFKRFYLKRFFRIIPAYLAVLILYYSLPNLREGSGLPPLWRFLTFTQNFGLDAQTQNSFSHAWSLCIEEQFYLILPIAIVGVFVSRTQKFTPYLIVALVILGFILRYYNWNEYVQPFIESGNRRQMALGFIEKVYYPSYNRMDGLLTGVAIAAISPNCVLYRFRSKFTFIIATLSYAIYLSHKQLYHLVKIAIERLGYESLEQSTFWICILIAVFGGLILHLLIEKPFMKLRKKILFWGEG